MQFIYALSLVFCLLACENTSVHRAELIARRWKIVAIDSPDIRKNLSEATPEEKKAYEQNMLTLSKNLVIDFNPNGNYTRTQKNTETPDAPFITKGKWELSRDQKAIQIIYNDNIKENIPIISIDNEKMVIEVTEDSKKSTLTLKPL